MDITEPSKSSNGATRKRRSSILKSQRPPRTPFSDLEFFNVATPTETTTSRRVSFSRRTSVAEFVTNEATTTWKNVYEEQNKSLESSNNENEVKRQPLGHIGSRQFDDQYDQFQLVNYAEHIASIDCTENDGKLIAPQQNFELSCFTDHQNKLFSDNIVNPDIVEMTDHIDINFSVDQQNNASREIDDLDEIQKVILQPRSSNAMVFGPSKDGRFIELDLNTTQVTIANEQSDMSITDTIHSSVVASSSSASLKMDKSLNKKDWVADKENIVVNPYSAPPENEKFAINSDDDQVLVFDGKRLTRQGRSIDLLGERAKSSGQNVATKMQRKPLVITDDLPDFIDNTKSPCVTSEIMNVSANTEKLEKTILYDDSNDISITQAVGCVMETQMNKNKTVTYCNDDIDISLTIAVPNNIISENVFSNKSKTVIYESDSADISVTQALPTKVIEEKEKGLICDNEAMKQASPNKCTTIVFENDDCDISVTQAAISSNILQEKSKKNRNSVSQNTAEHISVTQALPSNLIIPDNVHDKSDSVSNKSNRQSNTSITVGHNAEEDEKRTIVYQDDAGDISLTQGLPSNLIICDNILDKSRTIINNRQSDISVTSAVASNLIVCNSAEGHMSMTQALPINILESQKESLNITQTEQNPKEPLLLLHKSMLQDKTSSLSSQMIQNNVLELNSNQSRSENRKTIVFNNDMGDVSLTQAISGQVLVDAVQQNHILLSQNMDISMTEVTPKIIKNTEENTTITPDESIDHDMSITRAVLQSNTGKNMIKNITIAYENDALNMSMTKPIPDAFLNVVDNEFEDKGDKYYDVLLHKCPVNNDIVVYQTATAIDTDTSPEESIHNVKCDISNNLELSNQSIQNVLEKSSEIQNTKTAAHPTENHNKILNRQSISPDLSIKNGLTLDLVPPSVIQPKKSILNYLLDMSNASLVDGFENKNVMAVDKQENSEKEKSLHSDTSINSIFYIIKDSDKVADLSDSNSSHIVTTAVNIPKKIKQNRKKSIQLTNDDVTQDQSSEPVIQFEAKQSHVKSLEKKFNQIKHFLLPDKKINAIENKQDLYAETENEVDNEGISQNNSSLQINNCDNTKDLLDMLSDLSETRRDPSPTRSIQGDSPIDNSRLMRFDNKSESCVPFNLSCLANRQSIVLSREDLIKNLSMAQANDQESQMDIDENLILDDTANIVSTEPKIASKKTVRLSSNVVKALQFEDESVSEMSVKSLDKYISPIRKTAFGETSYMNESKAKVIPSYMEDVAKNIKALMNDLVKPMADVLPYKAFDESKGPCKCDNQIQADIITSSQIDLEGALQSTPPHEIDKAEILVTKDITAKDSTCSILHYKLTDENNEMELDVESNLNASKQGTNSVLCFDPHNPLNNVLLAPIDACEAHKYNPLHSTDSFKEDSELSSSSLRKVILQNPEYDAEIGLVSTYFNENDKFSVSSNTSDCEMISRDSKSISKLSKRMSIDRAIDVRVAEVKNIDCNTMIAMKPNKELLDASSSLTLVDDALNQKPDEDIAMCDEIASTEKFMQTYNEKYETNDADKKLNKTKPKKRIYSPSSKRDLRHTDIPLNIDVTPKPASKILRRSGNLEINQIGYNNAPQAVQVQTGPFPEIKMPVADVMKKSPTKNINKQSTKDKKPLTSITVQHLMTEFQMNDEIDENKLNKSILEVLTNEVSKTQIESEVLVAREASTFGSVNSFTSSNNQMPTFSSEERLETMIAPSISSESNSIWVKESRSEAPSSKLYAEFEPSVNIVAKINLLPFMGDTSQCEWESSSGDTWSFLLLFGRVRLTVRLAHRIQNALRSSVRADTPVTHLALDIVPLDIKNPVGLVCVPYALEAMRVQLADVCVAAQVPALLRRCATVTRLATRWARTMHDARLQLAFKLAPDLLVLKVANIRLRCVWEVSMSIEMVESEERCAAYPCVRRVTARSVLDGRAAPGERGERDERDAAGLRAIVRRGPRGWGHVPSTLWEVYEYLKNKKREDDLEFRLI